MLGSLALPYGSKKQTTINPVASTGTSVRAGIGSRSANAAVKHDQTQHKRNNNSVINQVSNHKKTSKSHTYSKSQIRIAGMIGHVV